MYKKIGIGIVVTWLLGVSIQAAPCGAVLYRQGSAKHYSHFNVPDTAYHHYFGFLEGPAWENKYCLFRTYVDTGNRTSVDIAGKYKPIQVLQNFDDPTIDEHTSWPWGTDIFKSGASMGLGSFRLFYNNQWLNPQIGKAYRNLDSLVISIVDSTIQTPKVTITYYGWNIGSGSKINVIWTVTTNQNERPTQCELSIIGAYTGKVVIGLIKNTGIDPIQDPNKALLATLGKQGGLNEGSTDTLLLAVYAAKSYFSSFTSNTLNYGMVLTPDSENKVKWSIAFSWAKEDAPVFRNANWQDALFAITKINDNTGKAINLTKNSIGQNNKGSEFYSMLGRRISSRVLNSSLHKTAGLYLQKASDGSLQKRLSAGK